MSHRLARSTLALVLAAAGCGGSSALSTSQYESKGAAALTPLLNALNALKGNPANAAGWTTVRTSSQNASVAFAKMKVPAGFSSLNSQLSSSLGNMGTAAGKLGTDIAQRNVTAARADLASYKSALQQYGGVIAQLGSKGVRFVGS